MRKELLIYGSPVIEYAFNKGRLNAEYFKEIGEALSENGCAQYLLSFVKEKA